MKKFITAIVALMIVTVGTLAQDYKVKVENKNTQAIQRVEKADSLKTKTYCKNRQFKKVEDCCLKEQKCMKAKDTQHKRTQVKLSKKPNLENAKTIQGEPKPLPLIKN